MGPDTHRAIFGTLPSDILGVVTPMGSQLGPGPGSYVDNVSAQLEYGHLGAFGGIGLDSQYSSLQLGIGGGLGMNPYAPTFNVMGPAFPNGFAQSQIGVHGVCTDRKSTRLNSSHRR